MKATRKSKILIAALLTSLMVAVLGSLTVSAATDGTEIPASAASEEFESAGLITENETPPLSESSDALTSDSDSIDESAGTDKGNRDTEISENVLANIYETVKKYAGEIFSSLAFIGTLIVAFIYKKGILPVITRTTSAISTLIGKLRDEHAEGQRSADDKLRLASDKLDSLESDISEVSLALSKVTDRLAAYGEVERERKCMRKVMDGQIDMLYSIFMSSALPQYRKDEVGERITAMKKELTCYENTDEKC